MSEREELAGVIEAKILSGAPAVPNHVAREIADAAADAILARRPADDEGLVEMARKKIGRRTGVHPRIAEEAARSALSVYRAHDPLLREAREALERIAGPGWSQVSADSPGADMAIQILLEMQSVARAVLRKLEEVA